MAIENGNITLSVRNPLDKENFELEGTVLSQGRLAHLGSVLTPTVLPSVRRELDLQEEQSINNDNQLVQPNTDNPDGQTQSGLIYDPNIPVKRPKSVDKNQNRQSPRWGVTVIRGRQTKVEEFEASGDAAAGAAAEK